ncbi:LysR family transcriptional regulator [Clostridium sp. 'deep sea']|uniref:selenium metabolism-associated LysR family transcriptional regulator n=1 Tax=Clostridium sp. 'deep sea' TaxID=2779445 RepID=UPI0018969CA7|nr:selenium metabolism-associated LysR family transcriptional regulator [Clostridium sp. 'deep sea']QOR35204.1 LysR family transcriptional regulator [Clostridium sp. 'deep sea']
MEFHQLESFINVVNLKSFSKAADELFITQPAITNNIKNLEKELNTILLNRKNKKITLTEHGKILYKYAVNLINIRDTAKFDINLSKNKMEGNLEININSVAEQYILPYIIKDFSETYPSITFTINHKDSKQVCNDIIKRGNINYGIIVAEQKNPLLEYIDLFEDELIIVVPNTKKYKYNAYKKVAIDFLKNQKIILSDEGSETHLLIKKALAEQSIDLNDLNIILLPQSNESIKKMVALGIGVSIISKCAVENELKLGLLKPYLLKDIRIKRKFSFVYCKNRCLSPIAEQFKNFLENWATEFNSKQDISK